MRLFVIAAMLAYASGFSALCQAVVGSAVENGAAAPKLLPSDAPIQRQRLRQPAVPGRIRSSVKADAVPPDAAVATLRGVCEPARAKAGCKTVITREDLDKFVSAVAPESSDAARARLAVQYAGTLTFSALAEKQGLERNPALAKELDQQIKLLKMRFLANAFLQNAQQRTARVTEAEIQRYYDLHQKQYEQAQVIRLALPLSAPTESGRPPERSAVKSEMEQLRTRALAGGDLAQLQQDAFNHLHIQAPPPPLNRLTVRRGNVPGEEAKAFDLKPGELSEVLDLPAAFAVLKLESKEAVPISVVRPEIEAALLQERIQDSVHKFGKDVSAEFNLPYLGLTSQPDIFALSAISPTPVRARLRRPSRMTAGLETSSSGIALK